MHRLLSKRKEILIVFRFWYIYITSYMVLFGYWTSLGIERVKIQRVGLLSGQIAVWFFIATLLPGIARRFKIQHIAFTFLMSIRRQLGVSMFLLGLLHYASLRLFLVLFAGVPLDMTPPVFEIFGFFALYSLVPLYITSNDYSVKKLGVWWRRVHSIAYITVWLIFGHVALQEFEGVAIVLGIVAILEVASLIYHRRPSV
ncbi:MAG: ferric reductase-like transmembrane domain-containing protein [Candidatus Roizmanbacteria bacterium]|nr:ferric reductase-like transmembrane domain-containing protein [Candidatus Roizmanbacteria bacterium]